MGYMSDENAWATPEMYDYAREAALPDIHATNLDHWAGADNVVSYRGDGQITSVTERLLESAAKQSKLESLATEIQERLKKFPEWYAGQAILALIRGRQGRVDKARDALANIFKVAREQDGFVPSTACWIIGQEMEKYETMRGLTISLFEEAMKDTSDNGINGQIEYTPARRLIELYKKADQKDKARAIVLQFAKKREDPAGYPPGYMAQQNLQNLTECAQILTGLGYPTDAVKLYTDVFNDEEGWQSISQWSGNSDYYLRNARQGMKTAMAGFTSESTLAASLKTLRTPRPDLKPGMAVLDMVLMVDPKTIDNATFKSLYAEALLAVASRLPLRRETADDLAKLAEQYPEDFSVAIAEALLRLIADSADSGDKPVRRLMELVDKRPLDDLSASARPNARQRSEAYQRIGLWLVARACWKRGDALRSLGDRFGDLAIEGASRQPDPQWRLAMLREKAQINLDRNDRGAAEAIYGRMLDAILANPLAANHSAKVGQPKPSATIIPPTSIDKFEQAAQLSKLAATHGMADTAINAITQAMRGGPPVATASVAQFGVATRNGPTLRSSRNIGQEAADPIAIQVGTRLLDLESSWSRAQIDPRRIYEVLRQIVLPENRPGEIFLYDLPLDRRWFVKKPHSVAELLVRYALSTGQGEDLRQRVEARKNQPLAEKPAIVLLGMLHVQARDLPRSSSSLEAIQQRLGRDTLRSTAELAFRVAIPALEIPELEPSARAVVDQGLKNLGNHSGVTELLLLLARHNLGRGDVATARKNIDAYIASSESTEAGNADYSSYLKRTAYQNAANEFVRAGQVEDALRLLGLYEDMPASRYWGNPSFDALPLLFRLIQIRPAADRYAMLHAWTMPAENRKSVRNMAEFVGMDVPPKIFAAIAPLSAPKILPSGDGFGLVSTAGMLIESAREVGKLDELTREIREAADQKIENAESMRLLVALARGEAVEVLPDLQTYRDALAKKLKPIENADPSSSNRNGPSVEIAWFDDLIARAATTHPATAPVGEAMLDAILTHARRIQSWSFQLHVNHDLVQYCRNRDLGHQAQTEDDPGLLAWHAETLATYGDPSSGLMPVSWVETEGFLSHLTGAASDYLAFDYPLTGRFEVNVDGLDAGWAEGQIAYGGLVFEAETLGMNSSVRTLGGNDYLGLTSRALGRDQFNRWTLQVAPQSIRVLLNGHLYFEESEPAASSPFLALFSQATRHPSWKNLTISGAPTIPREVRLTGGDRLEGWITGPGQSIPQRLAAQDLKRRAPYAAAAVPPPPSSGGDDEESQSSPTPDWISHDGEVVGRKYEPDTRTDDLRNLQPVEGDVIPGRLSYHRPLRDGDSIAYEFFHQPGATTVHPTLGQTALLLEPSGVVLRWLTSGGDQHWTGLKANNTAEIPGERRGDSRLPLRSNAWNTARVTRRGNAVRLELNGELIYEHAIDAGTSPQFGFYHDRARTSAKVRNVVLTGNWPDAMPAALLANPWMRAEPEPRDGEVQTNEALLGDPIFALSVRDASRKADALPPAERSSFLARWVLPSNDHSHFRLFGDFGPTEQGGLLRSPALDLIDQAEQEGTLDKLAARVDAVPPRDDRTARDRLAMLALIRGRQHDDAGAKEALVALKPLLAKLDSNVPTEARWAELVAATGSLHRSALIEPARDLLQYMVEEQEQHGNQLKTLGERTRHALALAKVASMEPDRRPTLGALPPSSLWQVVTHATQKTHGEGFPPPFWSVRDGEATHLPGHLHDYLSMGVPLRGDFEIECDLTSFNYREARLGYGGSIVMPDWTLKKIDIFHNEEYLPPQTIDPPLQPLADFYRFKLSIKDGQQQAFVDGRKIHEQPLTAECDPWVTLYLRSFLSGGAKNLKISGNPTIPRRLADLGVARSDRLAGGILFRLHLRRRQGLGEAGGGNLRTQPDDGAAATRVKSADQLQRRHDPRQRDCGQQTGKPSAISSSDAGGWSDRLPVLLRAGQGCRASGDGANRIHAGAFGRANSSPHRWPLRPRSCAAR